jgi:hypothetical protein
MRTVRKFFEGSIMKRWHNWHIFRQGSDTPVLTVRARHATGALLVAYKKLDLPIIQQRQLSARRAGAQP